MTSRNPLRVLLILPMLLASIYIAAPALPVAVHAQTGPSITIDPASIVTHSIGPAYPLVTPINNIVTFTISLHDVGTGGDMQAWNLVGHVNPTFFGILALPQSSISPLKPLCQANFGIDFYTTFIETTTGKFAASEYCANLSTGAGYTGTGGALLTLKLKVKQVGLTSITIDGTDTFLVTISNGVSSNIAVSLSNANFDNRPQFNGDATQVNVQGPKEVPCNPLPSGKCTSPVLFHVGLISNAPISMRAELVIVRPDHRIDRRISAPIAVNGTADVFITYTPPKLGFYQVSAIVFWTEDGVYYIYKGATTITRESADITVV